MYKENTTNVPPDLGTNSRSSALDPETVKKVTDYYQRDDISHQAPGRIGNRQK